MTRVWPVSPLMKTLPRVLFLLGLATLISNSSAWAPGVMRPPSPAELLLREYQSLGLPLPPGQPSSSGTKADGSGTVTSARRLTASPSSSNLAPGQRDPLPF